MSSCGWTDTVDTRQISSREDLNFIHALKLSDSKFDAESASVYPGAESDLGDKSLVKWEKDGFTALPGRRRHGRLLSSNRASRLGQESGKS